MFNQKPFYGFYFGFFSNHGNYKVKKCVRIVLGVPCLKVGKLVYCTNSGDLENISRNIFNWRLGFEMYLCGIVNLKDAFGEPNLLKKKPG